MISFLYTRIYKILGVYFVLTGRFAPSQAYVYLKNVLENRFWQKKPLLGYKPAFAHALLFFLFFYYLS